MIDSNARLGDLLGRLGSTGEVLDQQINQLARAPLAALKNLRVAYGNALVEANKFTKSVADTRVNLPPFGSNPTPKVAMEQLRPALHLTYHEAPDPRHTSAHDPLGALMSPETQRGAMMCRLLQTNPRVRAAFEKIAGGTVALDGRADGTVSMLPASSGKAAVAVTSSAMTSGGGSNGMPSAPTPNQIYQLLGGMDAEIMRQALAIQASQQQQGGASNQGAFTSMAASGLLGPTKWSKSSDDEDDEDSSSTSSTSSPLTSVDLTVPTSAAPVRTSKEVYTPTDSASSVDTATMQLQRMVTLRDQMYDAYRSMMDKYNQAAQKAIDAIR